MGADGTGREAAERDSRVAPPNLPPGHPPASIRERRRWPGPKTQTRGQGHLGSSSMAEEEAPPASAPPGAEAEEA